MKAELDMLRIKHEGAKPIKEPELEYALKIKSHPHPQQVVSENEIEDAINVNCGTGDDSDIPAFYFRMGIEWYKSQLKQGKGEVLDKDEEYLQGYADAVAELKSKELSGIRWTDDSIGRNSEGR